MEHSQIVNANILSFFTLARSPKSDFKSHFWISHIWFLVATLDYIGSSNPISNIIYSGFVIRLCTLRNLSNPCFQYYSWDTHGIFLLAIMADYVFQKWLQWSISHPTCSSYSVTLTLLHQALGSVFSPFEPGHTFVSTNGIQGKWQWFPRLGHKRHHNFYLGLGSLTLEKLAAMPWELSHNMVERNWSSNQQPASHCQACKWVT